MDLSTTYLGLSLRSPLVASSGPLTGRIESLRALEDAGIGAAVLPSLFEEQVVADQEQAEHLFDSDAAGNPEATSYFPDLHEWESTSDRYLRHLEEAKRTLGIPVIASVNGVSADGWERYARLVQDAGADAIELNLYQVAAGVEASGADVEAAQLELVSAVAGVLLVPLAVKVSPFYSAFGHFARGLVEAGADALVLFNRFYQPDLAPDSRQVTPSLELSTSAELRLPLRWIGLLHGRVEAELAATTGIHAGLDAAKALLAGAQVAMMTSALLRHGAGHVAAVEQALAGWGEEHGYDSIDQLRGSASQAKVSDPAAFERANYVEGLVSFANSFQSDQGRGPY